MTSPSEIEIPMTPDTTFMDVYKAISNEVNGNQEEIRSFLDPLAESAAETLEKPWVVEFELQPDEWHPCYCGGVATREEAEHMKEDHAKPRGDAVDSLNWRIANQLEEIRQEVGEERITLLRDLSTYFYELQPIDA